MHRYDRPRRVLACAIAGLAGFVDATGYLASNHYFVSFMSGNTTQLGVDLVQHPARALVPAGLIAGFVSGVVLGALIGDWAGRWRKSAVSALSLLLLGGAALSHSQGGTIGFLAFSVVAMGVLNNSFRQGGEVVVGVTYMTGALVRFGQGLAARLKGEAREGWGGNGVLWLSLSVGAMGGAASYSALSSLTGWIAAGLALAVLLMALLIERRRTDDQSS